MLKQYILVILELNCTSSTKSHYLCLCQMLQDLPDVDAFLTNKSHHNMHTLCQVYSLTTPVAYLSLSTSLSISSIYSNFCLMGPLISFRHTKSFMWVWLITLTQLLADHMANFGLIGHFISFWQLKQLHVGVVITKPNPLTHPCMVTNVYQLLGDHMPISSLVGPSISFGSKNNYLQVWL